MTVNKSQQPILANGGSHAKDRREVNDKAIPDAWRLDPALLKDLKIPLETSKNNLQALDLPRRSGILSPRELEITESYSVQQLLDGLANSELTSVEVTTAFCKRAAIAHQAVSPLAAHTSLNVTDQTGSLRLDQLPHRDIFRQSASSGSKSRFSARAWQTCRSLTWFADQSQRMLPDSWNPRDTRSLGLLQTRVYGQLSPCGCAERSWRCILLQNQCSSDDDGKPVLRQGEVD